MARPLIALAPRAIIKFEDGRSVAVILSEDRDRVGWSAASVASVIGIDKVGELVAESDGFAYTLTPCCGASYKGCDGYIGCRSCYGELDGSGMPWGDVTPVVSS